MKCKKYIIFTIYAILDIKFLSKLNIKLHLVKLYIYENIKFINNSEKNIANYLI